MVDPGAPVAQCILGTHYIQDGGEQEAGQGKSLDSVICILCFTLETALMAVNG